MQLVSMLAAGVQESAVLSLEPGVNLAGSRRCKYGMPTLILLHLGLSSRAKCSASLMAVQRLVGLVSATAAAGADVE